MDFKMPAETTEEIRLFKKFISTNIKPHLSQWYAQGEIPRIFFQQMGAGGWFDFKCIDGNLQKLSALRCAMIAEEMAKVSPGVAIAGLVHVHLGLIGLWLFGSRKLKEKYSLSAIKGQDLMCVGNTEAIAGSDAAGIGLQAQKTDGGWTLDGAKAYVTNGFISDWAIITAVTDPQAERKNRLSMFLVDLNSDGVSRKKLNKQVWIPSDLTRLTFDNVFVPKDYLLGEKGMGLKQVLTIFAYSRVPISALTLGTAMGAFDLAVEHARKREMFDQKMIDFQAKAFEMADFFARIEAARLAVFKACWAMDQNKNFRLESSVAKYLTVDIARSVSTWSADIFGAASVIKEHPIHKFPMDAWASSLGEGTQDVQKLVIFRELLKNYQDHS